VSAVKDVTAAAYEILAVNEVPDYSIPHSAWEQLRRRELLERRLDPLMKRRVERLGAGRANKRVKVGGRRGSLTPVVF
jgi:hypothetical protein